MNPTRLFSFSILIIIISNCYAGYFNISGAESSGLSGASIALTEPTIYLDNQALLSKVDAFSFGAHYYNRYGLSEISTRHLSVMHPLARGGAAYRLSYFGSHPYNELQAGVAYGLRIMEKMAIGAEMDYYNTSLETEEENQQAVSGDIALLVNATENFSIGVQATTISNSSYFNYDGNQINSGFRSGLAYQTKTYGLFTEAEFQKDSPTIFKAGIQLCFVENLDIRMGISNDDYSHYSFGLGYTLKGIYADVAFVKHPVLGFSSVISLGYRFKSNE